MLSESTSAEPLLSWVYSSSIFNMPEVARGLEEYRYLSLPGAHAKAEHNGYEGAQFPWESAWLDDGEVTPEYMGTDIVTGQLIKVWSGFIEIHITADVAYGVWGSITCVPETRTSWTNTAMS